jgi:DNA-directed RNA polymerase
MYKLYQEDRSGFEEIYLAKAKEKAQFISCFLALAKIKHGIGSPSSDSLGVPVLFDATCSGMQHLSSLATDISLASMVNVISGDKPEDFYAICASEVIE